MGSPTKNQETSKQSPPQLSVTIWAIHKINPENLKETFGHFAGYFPYSSLPFGVTEAEVGYKCPDLMHEEIAKRSKESMLLRQELPRSPSFLALQLFHRKSCGAAWEVLKESTGWLFFNERSKKRPDLPESQTNIDFSSIKASEKMFLDQQEKGLNLQVVFAFVLTRSSFLGGEHPFPPTFR